MYPCPNFLLIGCLVFKDPTVPFFAYVPDKEAQNQLPESVQNVFGVSVFRPPVDGVDDVAPFFVGASA